MWWEILGLLCVNCHEQAVIPAGSVGVGASQRGFGSYK